jgi:alkanesulfonate monooxygenase SsuD/methylene tetrahydromethanopterin reductase-like flavin-dependent oxidoreductase (luciferase family)
VPVPLLLAALAPRLLRVAGELTDGTILWMANARSIETHVAPRLRGAAEAAGRPAPRIVAGLPVAVVDDETEGRRVAAESFAGYGVLPNYRRILDIGGVDGPGDAAIVGDERSVAAQLTAMADVGTTDLWVAPFPVGDDREGRAASRARTMDLLRSLAN